MNEVSEKVSCPVCTTLSEWVEKDWYCLLCGRKRTVSKELCAAFLLLKSAGAVTLQRVTDLKDEFDE